MTTPVDVAAWIWPYWTDATDRITAISIAMARGMNPAQPGGVFGVSDGGDGPAQAATAYGIWAQKGWKAFPDKGSGRATLFLPFATTAASAYAATQVAKVVPEGVGVVKSSAEALGGIPGAITGAVDKLTDTLAIAKWLTTPNAWVRIAKVGIGIGLVFTGSFMIVFRTASGAVVGTVSRADDMLAASPNA